MPQVEGLGAARVVGKLSGDGEPVGAVAGDQLGGEPVGRTKVREADGDAEVVDAMAELVDGAALVEFGREAGEELGLGVCLDAAVAAGELVSGVVLSGGDEREEFRGVEPELRVEVGDVPGLVVADLDGIPTGAGDELVADERLQVGLGGFHAVDSST